MTHEDADEDNPVEPHGGMDILLGAALGGVEPRLEQRVGPAQGVDLDIHQTVVQQRVDPGEEQDEGQVTRRQRQLAHLASAIFGSGKEHGRKGLDLRAGVSGIWSRRACPTFRSG
jgi:hypothetical protein